MNWIHFIGKRYYTKAAFVAEAKKIGISRRISLANLKKINFGDRIFLAFGDSKGSEIFGYFIFDNILGLDHEIITLLCYEKSIENLGIEPYTISRGCRSYDVATMYRIKDTKSFLARLKSLDNDQLKGILIGGEFQGLDEISKSFKHNSIKTAIVFQQGYREFNYNLFESLYLAEIHSGKRRIMRLKNQFYMTKDGKRQNSENLTFAIVTEITNYIKLE